MKITRVQRIRNYRVFRDFSWPAGLPDFGRFNLIYGWNGSGKTTLSDLFRKLGNRQVAVEGEFEFLIDQHTVTNKNLDGAALPPIRVFNRNFVDASVFETVGKHLSPIYFLGEDSVEKQKQVELLKGELGKAETEHAQARAKHDAALSDFETLCTDQARIIKELLTAPNSPYNNYDKRNFKEAASKLKEESYKSLLLDEQQKAHLKRTKDGKPKAKIPVFQATYPDLAKLTSETQRLLGLSVVSRVLDELANDPHVASWVGAGLPLHMGDRASATCRFCGQTLADERLQLLQAHFNDDFKRFQAELADVISQVEAAKKQVEGIHPPESSLLYEHLTADYENAVGKIGLHRANVVLYLDALLKALAAKKESPFTSVALLPFFGINPQSSEPMGVLGTIFSVVVAGTGVLGALQGKEAYDKIGSLIQTHNNLTDDYVNEISKARKGLESHYVAEAYEKHKHKQEAIDSGKALVEKASSRVKELRDEIAALFRAIRQHHRPAAELTNEIRAYLDRDELTFVPHENGYSLTRYGQPATNLSEGERTAIAFLYFLKSLQGTDFDMKNGVVVIDDPVSSLDANSLYSAFGFMRDRTKDAGQLFILTHNFAFFRLVKNWFHKLPKKDARFYMLTSTAHPDHRNSAIGQLDRLLREYESEYHYLFKCVHEEANRSSGFVELSVNYGMPNIARRVLEAFLAFRVPGKANELHKQLEEVPFEPAKKARILRFLHTHSHLQQITEPEHDLSILAETQAVLQDVLRLIEQTDEEHYRRMLAIVSPQTNQEEGG